MKLDHKDTNVPSIRDIGDYLGIHYSRVQAVKRTLKLGGYLDEDDKPTPTPGGVQKSG